MTLQASLASDYNTLFKNIYYKLYSNSNTSRAERIVSDITKILLCKICSELNVKVTLKNMSNAKLISLLKKNFPQCCEQFDDFSLSNESISDVLTMLSDTSLLNAPSHIIGDAFQAIIGPTIRGDKGQFFTPKTLVDCLVKLINPQDGDVVLDPACGTGGFLIEAYNHAQIKGNISLYGIDKDKDMADITLATTSIITSCGSKIFNKNALEIIIPNDELNYLVGSVDIILTNPPFGAKIGITNKEILSQYEFGYNWKYSEKSQSWYKLDSLVKSQAPQILFLELCVRLLKQNGKMAIVLPEGIFGNKSLGYVLSFLKKNGTVLGMIDCPRNTFQPSTDTKTNVLIFQKTLTDNKKVKVAVAKFCGHDKRGRTKSTLNIPLQNDFAEIGKSFHSSPNDIWIETAWNGSYFVPRYLAGKNFLKNSTNSITIGEMIAKGYLNKKSGKEVGSEAYGTGNIPFIRTSDLNNFEISSDPTNSVSEFVYKKFEKQQNLKEGDILFIADGRYRIGKNAIITKYNTKCLIQSHIEILSLSETSPFTPYEFLYCLNLPYVQEQIRNLIFIQSTLGTLGNRINEIRINIPQRDKEWLSKMKEFQNSIELRAKHLHMLKQNEYSYEL